MHFTYEYEQEHSDETYWCSLPLPEEVALYLLQGNNARKVISEVYAFFVLQCTLFMGGKINTWNPLKKKIIYEIFWS